MKDVQTNVVESIETAIAHLAEALTHLDQLPLSDANAIGLVAHAMNNYVSVAEATLALLGSAVRDHPDPEVAGWIDGLRHLNALMGHAVGRLYKAPGGLEAPLRIETVNVSRLMERACDFYRSTAAAKELTITCTADPAVPPAWGDRVAVAVIADNLLSNAVTSSKHGGSIEVEIVPGPGGVVCRVRDAGPGLTAAEQARLFQPGPRVTSQSPDDGTAKGYGLLLVRHLLERMAGRVWVERDPGGGACVAFRLPYRPPDLDS